MRRSPRVDTFDCRRREMKWWRKPFAAFDLIVAYVTWRWRLFYWTTLKGASIARDVYLAPGFKILGKASNVSIGSRSSIGSATLHAHAPITIATHVIVNDHVEIIAGSHDVDSPTFDLLAKPVSVGTRAWIATRAVVLPGSHIGERAIVGAASVVTRPVGVGLVVAGNPAREVSRRADVNLVYDPFSFHPVSLSKWRTK